MASHLNGRVMLTLEFIRSILVRMFFCEDYMLQFLSVDSTCLSVYQDANGCHPLQDGSTYASESGTQ